jgi:hypothetical protein
LAADDDWPIEDVPDADTLFKRAHRNHIVEGEMQPSACFRDIGSGMSVNWQKYCATPEECRQKAQRNPMNNGVWSFQAGAMRLVPMLVAHSPNRGLNDRSHSDVIGDKTTEARLKMQKLFTRELLPDPNSELPNN